MTFLLGLSFICGWQNTVHAQTAAPSPVSVVIANDSADDGKSKVSGIPRLIRENPAPQVFFEESTNGNGVYISTAGTEAYNRVMNALTAALRSHQKVKLLIDKKTGNIVDLDGVAPQTDSSSVYDDSNDTPSDYVRASNQNGRSNNNKPSGSSGGSKSGGSGGN